MATGWIGAPPAPGATSTPLPDAGGGAGAPTQAVSLDQSGLPQAKWVPDTSAAGGHWEDGKGVRIPAPPANMTPAQVLAQNPGLDPAKLSYRDPPGGPLQSYTTSGGENGLGEGSTTTNSPNIVTDRQGFPLDKNGNRTADPSQYVPMTAQQGSTLASAATANPSPILNKNVAVNNAANGTTNPNMTPTTGGPATVAPGSPGDLIAQYNNFAPRQPPIGQAAAIAPVSTATAGTVAPTALAASPQVGAAAPIPHTEVGQPGQATAAQTGQVADIRAPQIGAVTTANAVNANAAKIDTSASDQIRGGQQSLIAGLQAAASGTGGPTAAEALHQKALDQAIAAQQGLVAGAHGTGRVAAQLKAGQNIGQITGQGAADAAALRAREMQDARAQLETALSSTRGQDVTLATTQAGFQNTANLQNSQLGTQVNLENAKANNVRDIQNANNILDALKSNQTTRKDLAITDASLANAVAISNANARTEMQKLQAQITSQEGIATAQQQNEMTRLQAQIDSNTGIANANNINAAAIKQAELNTSTNINNSQQTNAASIAQAGLQNTMAIANAKNQIDQLQLDDQAKAELLKAATTGSTAALSAATQLKIAAIVASTQASAATKQLIASILGGVAAVGAGVINSGALNSSGGGADTGGDIGPPASSGITSNPSDFTGDDG